MDAREFEARLVYRAGSGTDRAVTKKNFVPCLEKPTKQT